MLVKSGLLLCNALGLADSAPRAELRGVLARCRTWPCVCGCVAICGARILVTGTSPGHQTVLMDVLSCSCPLDHLTTLRRHPLPICEPGAFNFPLARSAGTATRDDRGCGTGTGKGRV